MSNDADLHSLDVLLIHDVILYGNVRHNTIGLIDQVTNIKNQINILNNASAADVYKRSEANEIFDTKADKSDTYSKTETDTLFDAKADKSVLIDENTKTETDTLLDAKADKTQLIDAYTKTETDEKLDLKLNIAYIIDAYSNTEDYALLLLKADKIELIDAYTNTETDEKLDFKANVVDVVDSYSKTETDTLLDDKADKTDTYTKTETDTLLDDKADQTDLANYIDLTSAQTISGQKYFEIINVSNISNQSKNDVSILLAGGGDMQVSLLVTYPQSQKVRDITTGKSKAYVFSTQEELNDWMAIQDKVAKLVIGDNLDIVDKEVTDYWWERTDLKILQTELSDIINVITTLGAATRNRNGKTDISIDGNTLIPAKNTIFVITGNDQSITVMETFTCTIISKGIQYSGQDNNSVFLASGGVRSSADICSASALLLLKADKTQFIDSYTKTQTNNLLNNKANQSTTFTKLEIDQLISQIDKGNVDLSSYYMKIKTDELLDEKADIIDLANYVTLDTAQTITANNTFNNNCRFVSSIDGISTVTGSSFIKSGADNTVVLLGAGGTKPISEFVSALTDLSNYYIKSETYSRTETDTKYVRFQGLGQQTITGRLKYVRPFDETYNETQYSTVNTYLTMYEVDTKLSSKMDSSTLDNLFNTKYDQTVNRFKTFTSNVSAAGFVKAGKDDSSVLIADG
ncbi:MAG: hypothetical protein EZS28_009269 [Streblomastix strix]|uniref:Uncharacterized protein n=1 Tax=Streblomastix strix TaxID=222440 RepID=A0A5J4WJL6_9EUKA|nr:MAG: hypothetical protein EZS28_009269 [Streblomastix strix]